MEVYRPGVQDWHVLTLILLENLPGVQAIHVSDPGPHWDLKPTEHKQSLSLDLAGDEELLGQSEHLAACGSLYFPGVHAEHVVVPPSENVPPSQEEQDDTPDAVVIVPIGHA
jgi:hypothetical protein